MKIKTFTKVVLFPFLIIACLGGCAPKYFIIDDYNSIKPASILVLPPINQTAQQGVEAVVYPIVVRTFGEKGYYVFSPEYVQEVFHRNKLQDAGRIHAIPTEKIAGIFGPDAILYIVVEEWSSKYYLIGNQIETVIFARLVDAKTAEELFSMRFKHAFDPTQSQSDIFGKMIMAIVSKIGEKSYLVPAARANVGRIAKQLPGGKYAAKW